MACKILTEVLSHKIPWEEFTLWLDPGKESVSGSNSALTCSRAEFVIYLINLLHDDAASIVRKSHSGNLAVKKAAAVHNKESAPSKRRNEYFCARNKTNSKSSVSQNSGTNSNRNSFHSSGVNSYQNRSIDDSINRNFSKHVPNEAVRSNNRSNNSIITPEKGCTFTPKKEMNKEELFLNSCPLSPIGADSNVLKISKPPGCANELDSPNNRMIHKDSRRPVSNKRKASLGRATSSPCNSSFNISEHSFPPIGSPARTNSAQKRRIKPTRLADSFDKSKSFENSANCFGQVVRPIEPTTPFKEETIAEEDPGRNETDFRDLLRIEKQKLQLSQQFGPALSQATFSPPTVASPDAVKCSDNLSMLANIYSILWDTNQISSIITELQFVLSLLTVQEKTLSDLETNNARYFLTVHECAYFATAILNHQRHLLSVLDKTSLKLLLDNNRIAVFTPKLKEFLQNTYEKLRISSSMNCSLSSEYRLASVSFQSDTDNRENFPTDRAFVTFRKQRDAFYEILGKWEENHTTPGWTFGVALGREVRALLNINNEPANFIHFARLFRSQLLGSCHKVSNPTDEEVNDDTMEVLKCLKEGNPDKYSRLVERLVTPFKSSNINTLPEFPGKQEFYRDFIVCGAHAIFNCHLIDNLWHEILSLSDSHFNASEVEDAATSVDLDTRQSFITCVRNLQLLAKFLGFVVFLPYQSKNVSEPIALSQSSLRVQIQPQIDVMFRLKVAIESRNLIFTAPWIVQFLSMVDSVSLNLSYYKEIIHLLYSLYRSLPTYQCINSCGRILLQVSLGCLFELSQFPVDSFYNWCLHKEKNGENGVVFGDASAVPGIDELDLIDWHCLHALCPSLETVKWLLLSDVNSVSNVVPRHITPHPVTTQEQVSSSAAKHLELQLEESFLEGQPQSVRSTIEFVSQRIASSCVKHVCGKPLQDVKEKGLTRISETQLSENKEMAMNKVTSESMQCSKELKAHCQEVVPTFCLRKCSAVLPLLFAEDMSEAVLNMCTEIAVRTSVEKVNLWINSHITPGLFAKDFQADIQKKVRNPVTKISHVLSSGWRDVPQGIDAVPPSETIRSLRNLVRRIMQGQKVAEEEMISVLNIVRDTLCFCKDLVPSAERVLGSLSVDLVLALVTYQPIATTITVLDALLHVWETTEVKTSNCFNSIVCPRNIVMLSHSSQKSRTWSAAAKLFSYLLEHQLLSPAEFETQCVALFQMEWPQDILKHIASCLEEVISISKNQNKGADESFVLLLELISELCQDMENFDL